MVDIEKLSQIMFQLNGHHLCDYLFIIYFFLNMNVANICKCANQHFPLKL